MKKFLFILLCLLTVSTLTSCDAAVSTWEFEEMEVKSILGGTTTYKDGDSFLVIGTVRADDYKLVINNDNTLSFGFGDKAKSGTWSKEDKVYTIIINEVEYKAEIVDGKLHLQYNLLGTDVVIKYKRG